MQLHLLADDIAHHGRICEEVVTEFNPDAEGYAYVAGRCLVDPIMEYCHAFGLDIDRTEAAYRSHMIIELSVDIFLRKHEEGIILVNLFQEALEKTETIYIQEFSRTLSWLFGIEGAVIREALNQGMMFYTPEKMIRFVDETERAPRYVRIFGLSDKNEAACAGMRDLMRLGMSLVGDPMDYLHGVVRTIRESPYCGVL